MDVENIFLFHLILAHSLIKNEEERRRRTRRGGGENKKREQSLNNRKMVSVALAQHRLISGLVNVINIPMNQSKCVAHVSPGGQHTSLGRPQQADGPYMERQEEGSAM